jgi:hypothetical protein
MSEPTEPAFLPGMEKPDKVIAYRHVRDGRGDDEVMESEAVEQGGYEIGGDY